jgi:hypothetical protein
MLEDQLCGSFNRLRLNESDSYDLKEGAYGNWRSILRQRNGW